MSTEVPGPKAAPDVVMAVKALRDGKASEGQQKSALEWILVEVCRIQEPSYVPGDANATMFAEGRRFAGLAIAKVANATVVRRKSSEAK